MALMVWYPQIVISDVEFSEDLDQVLQEINDFLEQKYGKRSDNQPRAYRTVAQLIIPGKM